MMIEEWCYPFSLPPLPYPYDGLAPYLCPEILHFHHDKHFATYVENLNKALEPCPAYHCWSLCKLLSCLDTLPEPLRTAVRNNGGGVYNHALYFETMGTPHPTLPVLPPAPLVDCFGGPGGWKLEMKDAAMRVFGSGYAWLVLTKQGSPCILSLPNQDNPLTQGFFPLLNVDVWEHAYYLQYQNRRAEYLEAWFSVIDWNAVYRRYQAVCR